jgi:hypothetical protein
MRRTMIWAVCVGMVGFAAFVTGCGKKTHPVKVVVDPSFRAGQFDKIAVFPFASALNPAADPNGLAPRTFDQLFRTELDKRGDYKWVAPSSVEYALQSEGLEQDAKTFVDEWRKHRKVDTEFLAKMGKALQVEGVLIGVVETWQQDQVDPRENATPASYAGATVTIFDVKDGHVLFEASDEDMLEGVRSEDRDKQIIRSGSGQIYSDPTASIYKAPPLEEVAVKVARSLAASIPTR